MNSTTAEGGGVHTSSTRTSKNTWMRRASSAIMSTLYDRAGATHLLIHPINRYSPTLNTPYQHILPLSTHDVNPLYQHNSQNTLSYQHTISNRLIIVSFPPPCRRPVESHRI